MCGAPFKSIKKQLRPGVVFRDSGNNVTITVLSLDTSAMVVEFKAKWRSGREEVISQYFRNWPDNYLSNYTILTFPKEVRLEDVL